MKSAMMIAFMMMGVMAFGQEVKAPADNTPVAGAVATDTAVVPAPAAPATEAPAPAAPAAPAAEAPAAPAAPAAPEAPAAK